MSEKVILLPFKPNAQVIELGGDVNKPCFHPNYNSIAGPGVDVVCDLNEIFPIESTSCDGIFSSYIIEHIRYARLRQFIAECYRVLRPRGLCMMVTANLLEQAKRLVNTSIWGDDEIYMVFGGSPDYPGNYHHCGFSPSSAVRLFTEAGFAHAEVEEHPVTITDMIIRAWKL